MLLWVREGELPDGVRRVEAKPQLGPRAFALPVRSRIMAPLFPAGARIIVDPAQSEQTDAFVVVQVEGWDEATFRRLVMDAGRTYLEPLNTDYRTIDISDEQYTYCGRVVWMELNLLNPLL